MCAPPLGPEDLEGFVDPARLDALNRDLAARPFGGLVVVCPYVPDIDLTSAPALVDYARFVVEVLLPRVRREPRALVDPPSIGIDGVSLGGAVALHVGLAHPLAFGAVGAIQPAIREQDAAAWTERARAARAQNPRLKLRLLTSDGDYFREAVTRTSQAWSAAGVDHEFAIVPGPHDYAFNRGPGSIELLAWHDRTLAHG
jgi:enterochelin esterase-like enzyme